MPGLRHAGILTALIVWMTAGAHAACPIPGQSVMTVNRLYFGRAITGGGAVTNQAWQAFLRDTVTPDFPDGFTVYEGTGQWRDPATKAIARERSTIVEIASPQSSDLATRIKRIVQEYERRYRQQSVGIVSMSACASF
jgi:hypothetical protein